MVQLKVLILGTSPAETLLVEEALLNTGCLETFRYLGLEQALARIPQWDQWDLLIARHAAGESSELMRLLAPVLRKSLPPVLILVDPFEPLTAAHFYNAGAFRVLPVQGFEALIGATLGSLPSYPTPSALPNLAFHNGEQNGADLSDGPFARLFQLNPIGISIHRARDGVCLDCNDRFARLLDSAREELVGRVLLELELPTESQSLFLGVAGGSEVRNRHGLVVERRIYTRERVTRYLQLQIDHIEWEREVCYLVFAQDITEKEQVKDKINRLNEELERLVQVRTGALEAANRELAAEIARRREVEQELRDSRERYRVLADAAHDIIFVVTSGGLIEYANEYACCILGFDPVSVTGMSAEQFFPKNFASNNMQTFLEVIDLKQPVYTEGPFTRGDEELWLGTWLVPVLTEQGDASSVLGISRDITEQKKTGEALQIALENERKLSEMRTNLFSMTSHQFRTPLTTILITVELLQKYGAGMAQAKRTEQLERIQEAALRLNTMLEDILMLGRVESGRYTSVPKEFDFIPFVQDIIEEIRLNDRGEHPIILEQSTAALPVYLDPEILQRVVDNLMSNAIKYSPKNNEIWMAVRDDAGNLVIEVTDQGIGIPEGDLKSLFQPFQRGSNATEFPGSGIGLTIIQKSVELLNGDVFLKSREGYGTTFTVRIPMRYEKSVK